MVQVTPSRIFLAFCVGILAGVFWATTAELSLIVTWAAALLGLVFVVFGFPIRAPFGSRGFTPVVFGFLALGMALGLFRAQSVAFDLAREGVTRYAEQAATVEGLVPRYPDVRLDGTRFWLDVSTVNGEEAEGRILVFADRSVAVGYGDVVTVEGKLQRPARVEDFDYAAYLAKDGIVATLRTTQAEVIGNEGNLLGRAFASSRAAIDRTSTEILPYREGAMLKALLLGDEGSLADDTKLALNRSGLRHIVAVSGMNITIIAGIVMFAALSLGLWRRWAFFAALVLISAFVALIGAPASAMRAAIMGLALRAAPILGRQGSGFRPAVFAAAVMALHSPFVLVRDVGFQLSFLAVLGIIFIGPMFSRWLRRAPKILREALAMTFSAQLAVTPLLLGAFGSVSVVSPLTNLFVVPALPLVTIWGFAAVGFGAFVSILGTIAALPLLPYFAFVGWIAEFGASLPWSSVSFSGPWLWVLSIVWFTALGFLAWREAKRAPRPIDVLTGEIRNPKHEARNNI